MIYTLENILQESLKENPVKISRIIKSNDKWGTHRVEQAIKVKLSNKMLIEIPKGFQTDLSSVPRLFWSIMPNDGDFLIAAVIHDYLYVNKLFTREFNDKEMLLWSKVMYATRKISIHNIDNYVRYHVVRLLGWFVWNRPKKEHYYIGDITLSNNKGR